jgi:DnaK suppressor protein
MLSERRRELQDDVRKRIRDGRDDRPHDVLDDLEHADADAQEDLEMALLQMRAETLARLDQALARIDTGAYGRCAGCDGEIADRRLRALPFAVRCQACEESREQAQESARPSGPSARERLALPEDRQRPSSPRRARAY